MVPMNERQSDTCAVVLSKDTTRPESDVDDMHPE